LTSSSLSSSVKVTNADSHERPSAGNALRYSYVLLWPILAALLLSWWATPHQLQRPQQPLLTLIHPESVEQLEQYYQDLHYAWPLALHQEKPSPVPRLDISAVPTQASESNISISVQRKKALFFRMLLPLVIAENQYLSEQHAALVVLFSHDSLLEQAENQSWLMRLMKEYKVKGDIADDKVRRELLKRVDVIPVSLVLAQAANESGWGTSRFVRQGNNLFGEWTYKESQGLVPLERQEGKRHLVRVFASLRESVRAYLRNLNTGSAYILLRKIRADMREKSQALDSLQLAAGLEKYSERGQDYIDGIRRLIVKNNLSELDTVSLRSNQVQVILPAMIKKHRSVAVATQPFVASEVPDSGSAVSRAD